MMAECLCFGVPPNPQPFPHTSTLSSNVTSSVKLSLASLVKLIMAFLPSFPPLGPYITATHFFLPRSIDHYLFPSTLYILKGKIRDFMTMESDHVR